MECWNRAGRGQNMRRSCSRQRQYSGGTGVASTSMPVAARRLWQWPKLYAAPLSTSLLPHSSSLFPACTTWPRPLPRLRRMNLCGCFPSGTARPWPERLFFCWLVAPRFSFPAAPSSSTVTFGRKPTTGNSPHYRRFLGAWIPADSSPFLLARAGTPRTSLLLERTSPWTSGQEQSFIHRGASCVAKTLKSSVPTMHMTPSMLQSPEMKRICCHHELTVDTALLTVLFPARCTTTWCFPLRLCPLKLQGVSTSSSHSH
mmetsp:Transcript_13551/g.39443  ORF Transcript_13551/g.39443 Transcript_13551/m.39443 type:complete len:258 (+) Transcript_13551:607-1380(+)